MGASVDASTLSNINIGENSGPIAIKSYQKHYLGGGKAALGFDADQIRTLVSMATYSSHRGIMGKTASSRFLDCFDRILYLPITMTCINAWMNSKFGRI